MATVLPRGAARSLMGLSFPLVPSSSFHSFINSLPISLTRVLDYSSLKNINIYDPSAMEKNSQEAIKDQQREGICTGACDIRPSKRLSSSADDIMPHILNLYGSSATPRDFEIYAPDASFEDPLMCAHGIKQIKSAFYSLDKCVSRKFVLVNMKFLLHNFQLFSESRIVDYSIKENVISDGKKEILIDNKQHYKMLGKDIDMISLIKLYVEYGKIVRHEDWWDKKPLWNRETTKLPLVGRFMEFSRRGSMMATHALMRFGKDPDM